MKISTFGARFYGGQIDRIDQGLKDLDCVVNYDDLPSVVYCNDMANYDRALIAKAVSNHRNANQNICKFILNVLDCPSWVPEWLKIKEEWMEKLKQADKVTCISQTVQKDIKQYFNIDATVIYNPIKNVYPLNYKKDIPFLWVGRAGSPNKKVREIIHPFYRIVSSNMGEDCLHFVGSEYPGFGVSHGIVTDDELNKLYNRALFCLISSKEEGLNLPLIESLATETCIPIVCKHLSTAFELAPPKLLCESTYDGMLTKVTEVLLNMSEYVKICSEYGALYREKFSSKSVAQNIINVYNSIT